MHVVGCSELKLASPEIVKKVTGAEIGYAGFLNLPKAVRVVFDNSLEGRKNFEVGANRTNYHSINVNFGRDFPEPEQFHDIALAKEGYLTDDGQHKLVEKRGIEVGNIFQLGYHYSNLMVGAEYADKSGKRQKYYMGCYGIGIGRTLAAIVEAYHDKQGMIWPENVAPFEVYIARLGVSPAVVKQADELYERLTAAQTEVLYDDRDTRPGEKFADADLLGIPYRVVISDKTLDSGTYELKGRTEDTPRQVSAEELAKTLGING
jgi:prolyl-tRNA synthetase